MRASESEQTAAAGQNEVKARFERIGWGPVDNPYHDLGTDLYLAVRDERLHDRRLVVGAQVKSGKSWFDDAEAVEGEVVGWWFYEPGKHHFDDWAAHALPFLIVLHDMDENVSFWVHVTPDRIVDTGKGCRILVPSDQTVDAAHLDELLAVAASKEERPPLEGTAWSGAAVVAPGRLWRHALVAPRLVAPHRNRGFRDPISPPQGAALVALARLRDLHEFAEQHTQVHLGQHAVEPDSNRDWLLVDALIAGLTQDEPQLLETWLGDPSGKSQEVAASVALAATLYELERADEALTILGQLIADTAHHPIDHGWASMQRARIRAELGLIEDARADADVAIRSMRGDAGDVTATAITSSAAWLLFTTVERGMGGSLADTLTKGDTAVSWWRSQVVSNALSEHFDRVFNSWAADSSTRFTMEDTLTGGLVAAVCSAALLGDQGSWRSYSSLLGRHAVLDAHAGNDLPALATGLDLLRRSGDGKALKLAARRLLDVGPLEPLARAATRITERSWTHTSAVTNLELWYQAGDLLDSRVADSGVETCLGMMLEAEHPLIALTTPRFWISTACLEAIGGLLSAATHEMHARVVSRLLDLARETDIDQLVATDLRDVVNSIRWAQVTDGDQRSWLEAASATNDRKLGAAVVVALAQDGNTEALEHIREGIRAGDVGTLLAHNDVNLLDTESAALILESVAPRLDKIVSDARASSWSMYEWSAPAVATVISLRFPAQSCWDRILELLFEPLVSQAEKAVVCRRLAQSTAGVLDYVREELAARLPDVRIGESDMLGGPSGLQAVVDRVALSLGLLGESETAGILAAGVTSPDHGIRSQTAAMLGDSSVAPAEGVGALVGLANDASFVVRRSAAAATATRVRGGDTSPLLFSLLAHFVSDPGRTLPLVAVHSLAGEAPLATEIRPLVEPLLVHYSAHVRQTAERVLAQS